MKGRAFWMQVITELKTRGVQDIFIACVDGLKGFPEAIEAIYPNTQIQLCIVHLVRHSLFYVSHKDRKEIAQDLKLIYQAPTLDEADYQLGKFADKWNGIYPVVVKSWRANWMRVIPMFSFAPEIRRAIYTTNTIESLNMTLSEGHQKPGDVPVGRSGFQDSVFSLEKYQQTMDKCGLADWSGALEAIRYIVWKPLPSCGFQNSSFTQSF